MKSAFYKLEDGRYAEVVEEPGPMHKTTVNVYQGRDKAVEIDRTPLQDCGMVTFLGGAYALIRAEAETTVHVTGKHTDDEVIEAVYVLAEKMGLRKAISKYKDQARMLDPLAAPEGLA